MIGRFVLAMLLLAGTGFPISSPKQSSIINDVRRQAARAAGQGTSSNWAGYVQTGQSFTSITGSWTVPSVSYVNYPGWSDAELTSTWIGIGGSSDGTLIQLGTTQGIAANGTTTYKAWYLLVDGLNNAAVDLPNPVSPGDKIQTTLQCVSSCAPNTTQQWKMSIRNLSKNWTWDNNGQAFSYKSSLASAEWIMEAPTKQAGGQIAHLPNYGSVEFTNATANGSNPNLSLLRDGLSMIDSAGNPISLPGAPVGGNSFKVNQVGGPPSKPLPQNPSAIQCNSGQNLGELTPAEQSVQGTVGGGNASIFYRFYATQYFRLNTFSPGGPGRPYVVMVRSDLDGRELEPMKDTAAVTLDPGYYCLKVTPKNPVAPAVPYKVQFSATPIGGFVPPQMKQNAFFLAQLELGQAGNGYYGNTRYIHYQSGPVPNFPHQIEPGHEYFLRDWLGGTNQQQWYKIELKSSLTIILKIGNLYLGANAHIETEDGTIVAAATSNGVPLVGRVPDRIFEGVLPAGLYYLRLSFAGVGNPGTPYYAYLIGR